MFLFFIRFFLAYLTGFNFMHTFIRHTLGPLFLILICPPFVMLMWYTNTALEGSFLELGQSINAQGFFTVLMKIWGPFLAGTPTAWVIIAVFIIFQLCLLKLLPGRKIAGPITPQGNIPYYTSNGIAAFTVTVISFIVASVAGFFPLTVVYDNFGGILGALNCFSLILCLGLYFKGRFFPSSTDASCTGNFIIDYYWGTELYPEIAQVNLKMFINCRLGMMSWAIIILSYASKQYQLYGLSNSMVIAFTLQFIYIAKFFVWESGYLASLDIMHDRAGFYICWGCLVWVPCIYTSSTMYLVHHPHHLNPIGAALIFTAGIVCIWINYSADKQRQTVRATQGLCKVWGKNPQIIKASYYTQKGELKENLLLSSGWWGIARHFHYLPEILAAFFWSVPALFTHVAPYFYVTFLTILLVDRAFRDDKRCANKYGSSWNTYCATVPYKIIPFVL